MRTTKAVLLAAALFAPAAAISAPGPYGDELAYGVHDDGLLWLKVWNRAFVGDPLAGGSGIYPAPDGPANIHYGAVWVGTIINRSLYVSGDWHSGKGMGNTEWRELPPSDAELLMSNRSNWTQRPSYIKQVGTLDSYCLVDDRDAGESGPIPVVCDVHGISWSRKNLDDFVAFRYHVKNANRATLTEVHVAAAYDFDIGGPQSRFDDYVGFDRERQMPYMYDKERAHPYLGLVCVDGPVRGARSWSSDREIPPSGLIFHPGFEPEKKTPNDWCVFLSSGPYSIPAGKKQTTTFAVVAGANLEELQDNADAALAAFKAGPRPEPIAPVAFNLAQNRPNPVASYTKIRFACQVSAKVKLTVYDLAGRRVATLADGIYRPGTYELEWRPRNVAPGVYVYTLEAVGERFVKAMVVAP